MKLRNGFLAVAVANLVGLGVASLATADCHSFTNALGTTEIRCDDGTTGVLYRNEMGGIHGRIGNKEFNSYTNEMGGTHGRFGDVDFNSYTNEFGGTHGRFGDVDFNSYPTGMGTTAYTWTPTAMPTPMPTPTTSAYTSIFGAQSHGGTTSRQAPTTSTYIAPVRPYVAAAPSWPGPASHAEPNAQSGSTILGDGIGGVIAASPSADHAEGQWTGLVVNTTVGVQASLKVSMHVSGGVLSGNVAIASPLSGSGSVSGQVSGDHLSFTTRGGGWVIQWEGDALGAGYIGTYRVLGTNQVGVWSVRN